MAGFPYEESERQHRRLGRKAYAEWVAGAFPWKLWSGPWSRFGGWGFGVFACQMAPGDPPRIGRKARQEKYKGLGGVYEMIYEQRRTPVKDYEAAILKHLSDGRPRTLNRMAVEMLDMNGCAVPHRFQLALQRLLYERKLAFAHVAVPGGNEKWPLVLLWNDATWRRAHPEHEGMRRPPGFDQLEIAPTDAAVLPSGEES